MPPQAPFSALSAEHAVTAAQYNNLISGLRHMPVPSGLFASANPTATGLTMPSAAGDLATSAMVLFSTPPSGTVSIPILHWRNIWAYWLGPESAQLIAYRGNPLSFATAITSTGFITAAGAQAAWTATGVTNGVTALVNTPEQFYTAQYGNPATARWNMGAIYTGTLVIMLDRGSQNNAGTASAIIAVSTDDISYTTVLSVGSAAGAAGFQNNCYLTAGVPAQWIRVLLSVTGNANPSTGAWMMHLWFSTASGIVNVPSGAANMVSAYGSGEVVVMQQSAAGDTNVSAVRELGAFYDP